MWHLISMLPWEQSDLGRYCYTSGFHVKGYVGVACICSFVSFYVLSVFTLSFVTYLELT